MALLLLLLIALGRGININPSLTLSVSETGSQALYTVTRNFLSGEGWFALGFPNQHAVGMDQTRAFICTNDGLKVYDIEAKTTMQPGWRIPMSSGSCTIFDNHAVMVFEADPVPLDSYTFVWAMNPSGEWDPEAGFESCWHGPSNMGEFSFPSTPSGSSFQPSQDILDQQATINVLKNLVAEQSRHIMLQASQAEHEVRSRGSSGATRVRSNTDGTHNYAADGGIGNGRILAFHNHNNFDRKLGIGEFGAVLNGIRFDTRHNDYMIRKPAQNADVEYNALEDISFPDVPPSVLAQPSVEAEILEMQQYFKAFKAQDKTLRDFSDFFKPVLCYLEGAWIKDTDRLEEFFHSERHSIHAETWKAQFDAQIFRGNSGKKHVGENVPFLPTKIVDVQVDSLNNISYPVYANFEYRIACQPIEGEVPTKRFILDVDESQIQRYARGWKSIDHEDLKYTGMGRFKVNGLSEENWKFNEERGYEQTPPARGMEWNFLDKLMEQMPGKDGPNAVLKDDSFDVGTLNYEDSSDLNTAFYSRFFSYGQFDANGRSKQMRGYNDLSLWAAMTTHEKVAGYKICQTEYPTAGEEPGCWEQKWTYAIPLEIVYLTPLYNWNPYGLQKFDSWRAFAAANEENDGTADSPFQGYSESRYFAKTPQVFYTGENGRELADTGLQHFVETSAGTVEPVASSGTKIVSDPIGNVGSVRLRWPIFPIHDRSSLAFREVTALGEKIRNEYKSRDEALSQRINSLETALTDLVALVSSSALGELANDISSSFGGYILLQSHAECKSADQRMGTGLSLQECADAVREHGGTYFIIGTGRKEGRCYVEYTTADDCPEGWRDNQYDFYKLIEDTPVSTLESGALKVGQWTQETYPVIALRSGAGIPESHTHDVFCDWNCFVLLMNGEEVTVTSEDWDGHTHAFTFKLTNDHTSIVFLECDSCGIVSDALVALPSTGSCPRGTELTEEECENIGDDAVLSTYGGAGTYSLPETCGCYIDQRGKRYFNRLGDPAPCNRPDGGEQMICKEYTPTDPHNSILIMDAYQQAFLDGL